MQPKYETVIPHVTKKKLYLLLPMFTRAKFCQSKNFRNYRFHCLYGHKIKQSDYDLHIHASRFIRKVLLPTCVVNKPPF